MHPPIWYASKFHFFIEFALGKFCFAMHGERIGFRNLVLFFFFSVEMFRGF